MFIEHDFFTYFISSCCHTKFQGSSMSQSGDIFLVGLLILCFDMPRSSLYKVLKELEAPLQVVVNSILL